MPKRFLFALAIISLTLAACNSGYTEAELFGVAPTATPKPTPYIPNPQDTAATIQALVSASPSSSPVPDVIIYEATPDASGNLGASPVPMASARTDALGEASFSGLVYTGTYCWWWVPQAEPTIRYSGCFIPQQWQSGVIPLGTGF